MTPPPTPSTLFPYTTLFRSFLNSQSHRHLLFQSMQQAPQGIRFCLLETQHPFFPVEAMQFLNACLRGQDRKSTRLNSSHSQISYAVFCLKKKKERTVRGCRT